MALPHIPPWLDFAASGLALALFGFELTNRRRGRPAMAILWLGWAFVFAAAAIWWR